MSAQAIDAAQASAGAQTRDTALQFVADACVHHAPYLAERAPPSQPGRGARVVRVCEACQQLPYSHRRAPEEQGTQAFVVTSPWRCVLPHFGRSPRHSVATARRQKDTCHKHLGQEGPNNVKAQRVANHCPKLAIADVPLAYGRGWAQAMPGGATVLGSSTSAHALAGSAPPLPRASHTD